jgi:hypothetical protein
MSRVRASLRWTALIVAVIVAATYLNSAAYSFWVAGGPPSLYPESWVQRGLVHLCWSGAALFVGIATFRTVRTFPRFGAITIALAVTGLLLLGVGGIREFLLTDRCLDRGGIWNSTEFRCVK